MSAIPDDLLDMSIGSDFEENANDDVSFDYSDFADADDLLNNSSSSSSSSRSSTIYCCCGCMGDATYSSHVCSLTKKKAMAYCLTGEEGYGSISICVGCENGEAV